MPAVALGKPLSEREGRSAGTPVGEQPAPCARSAWSFVPAPQTLPCWRFGSPPSVAWNQLLGQTSSYEDQLVVCLLCPRVDGNGVSSPGAPRGTLRPEQSQDRGRKRGEQRPRCRKRDKSERLEGGGEGKEARGFRPSGEIQLRILDGSAPYTPHYSIKDKEMEGSKNGGECERTRGRETEC